MELQKFNGFDKNGYLPPGAHKMTLKEVKELFSKNKTKIRSSIMEEYEKHLKEIEKTGYCLEHWIDGSFVTLKENPNDIDTLTELDGEKVDENADWELIHNLIDNSKENTNGLCHSLKVYKYPPERRLFKIYCSKKKNTI